MNTAAVRCRITANAGAGSFATTPKGRKAQRLLSVSREDDGEYYYYLRRFSYNCSRNNSAMGCRRDSSMSARYGSLTSLASAV